MGVTGATGFLGRRVLAALSAKGDVAVPLVRAAAGLSGEIVIGDLESAPTADCGPLDAMIHLAARSVVTRAERANAEAAFHRTNVDGTQHALALAHAAGARRFILLSSIKVNGSRTAPGQRFAASDMPQPDDAYGRSKWAAEQLAQQHCTAWGMELVVLRPPLIYGPRAGGNLGALATLIRSGIPIPLGSVKNRRSMAYVDNIADLIATTVSHPVAAGKVWMAADGTTLSTPELIRTVAATSGRTARLFAFPTGILNGVARLLGAREQAERLLDNLEVDHESVMRDLDWRPPIAPSDALRLSFAQDVSS